VYSQHYGTKRSLVWIADADGRGRHRLARGNYGLVSPQGDVVAVDRGKNLYLVRSDGSGERLLARDARPYLWAPNGRTLLVDRGGWLYSLDVRSGRTTLLVRDDADASISPDSRAVVYATGGCAEASDLRVVGLDGRGRRQLTHDGRSAFPLWGPRHITFSHVPPSCVSSSLWRIRPDGSRRRPVLARVTSRFKDVGYYGFRPLGWLADRKHLVVGLSSEWGNERSSTCRAVACGGSTGTWTTSRLTVRSSARRARRKRRTRSSSSARREVVPGSSHTATSAARTGIASRGRC
jgi:hypothetical protein